MNQSSPRKLCRAEEIAVGESRIFPVGRHGGGVFNVGGQFHALDNCCPHTGAPVCRGKVTGRTVIGSDRFELIWEREGEILRCPWHQWEFAIDTGDSLSNPRRRVKARRIYVEDGWIHVDV
jgi:nitrite reductase (NADH) small subunit